MKVSRKTRHNLIAIAMTLALTILVSGCGVSSGNASGCLLGIGESDAGGEGIPEYQGEPYVEMNNNVPQFEESLVGQTNLEEYGKLDRYGRCTNVIAVVSTDTQPSPGEERGDISEIHPSGWMSAQGWERCHLIAWSLTGQNDNERNLVTGSHYMNTFGMGPFENKVRDYIENTGNHVLYQVTPLYKGKDKVCSGVQMQAMSVEDKGRRVSFNVFCFNVDPGKIINYKTGQVTIDDEDAVRANYFERTYVLNTSSKKFHYPSCESVGDMSERNKETVRKSRQELIDSGYQPCGRCEP